MNKFYNRLTDVLILCEAGLGLANISLYIVRLLMSKVVLFGLINSAVLLLAISHAYQLNGTFYASCVYFVESKISMIVLGTFGLYCMFLFAKLIKAFFLGPLRLIEREHVTEYSWITLSETFLAMTIFKNEIDSIFVFSFAVLMTFKIFHWILRDRIDYMEQVVQLPKDFIYKIGTLLSLLIFSASFMITNNVMSVIKTGPSMAILFANEYALTLVSLIGSAIRFSLNCIDALCPESPFEQRSTVIFYLDFFVDLFKLLIYTGFFGVVMSFYGLPIHIIRDLYVTAISFSKRVKDMINYHRIMSSLQTRYPDVTPEELQACSDPTCIICREEMVSSVKRLPCGHFFHFKCLKSWLERQQVCPTCRKSVLEVVKPTVVQYPADHRREWNDSDSNTSFNTSQSSFNTRNSQTSLNTHNNSQTRNESQGSLNRSHSVASTTRLLLSPLRRSHSTSSLFPLQPALLMDEDEKEILISEGEKLKIVAELERLGRRSRSPLSQSPHSTPTVEDPVVPNESPLSPLSHVKSKIEYVQELMSEHENILAKLRQIETEIIREKSFSRSASLNFNESDHDDGHEKDQ